MTLKNFIKRRRQDIDKHVRETCGGNKLPGRIDDEEREMWVRNDESLYNWAKAVGVNFNE